MGYSLVRRDRLAIEGKGYYAYEKVVYGNLARVLDDRNILLQLPKPLSIKEKSSVLGCQTSNCIHSNSHYGNLARILVPTIEKILNSSA